MFPNNAMRISKGLTQAYQLQDFTYQAAISLKDSLLQSNGKLHVTREDAQSIAALVKSWESCQQRIQVHRRVPNPGSLKHNAEPRRRRRAQDGPVNMPVDLPAGQAHVEPPPCSQPG